MFEPRHLKAYLALVKCMHFGRAAEMLGISQPTLSQQIRMLEEAVGAPLINRSNRTMELTPVGRVLLKMRSKSSRSWSEPNAMLRTFCPGKRPK